MEKFFYKNKLIGIRARRFLPGIESLTAKSEPLQILALKHPRGKKVLAHSHKPLSRRTSHLEECVIVIKGKIKITLYGSDKKRFKQFSLKTGELFMLMSGGHALEVLEDAEIFEIKNGPYKDDRVNF